MHVLSVASLLILGGWMALRWSRKYKDHVPHPEFVRRFENLPEVEGKTRKRF